MRGNPGGNKGSVFKIVAPEDIFRGAKPHRYGGLVNGVGGSIAYGDLGGGSDDFMVLVKPRQKCRGKHQGASCSGRQFDRLNFFVTPSGHLYADAAADGGSSAVGDGNGDHAKRPLALALQRCVVRKHRINLAIDSSLDLVSRPKPNGSRRAQISPICGGV